MERGVIAQLLALAAGQDSLVTVEQAAAFDVTAKMLRTAVDRGWLQRQRRGVYVVAGAAPSRWRPVRAAALAAGPDAVVSHTTAAAMHNFYGVLADGIELTMPDKYHTTLNGVTIHRSSRFRPI